MKYAEHHGITAQAASRLFIFIGLFSSLGRAVAGMLYKNKKVNPIFIHQASLLTLSLSVFLLQFTMNYWSLVLFSIVYGFSDGVFSTGSVYIPLSCVDSKRKTASFSTNCFLYSFAVVSGSPIAGEFFVIILLRKDPIGQSFYDFSIFFTFYLSSSPRFDGDMIPINN